MRRCETEPNKGQRGPGRGALQEKEAGLLGTKEAGSEGSAQAAGTRGGALDTWLCIVRKERVTA